MFIIQINGVFPNQTFYVLNLLPFIYYSKLAKGNQVRNSKKKNDKEQEVEYEESS